MYLYWKRNEYSAGVSGYTHLYFETDIYHAMLRVSMDFDDGSIVGRVYELGGNSNDCGYISIDDNGAEIGGRLVYRSATVV